MNKRYEDLKVADGVYVPKPQMDYPEDDPYLHLVNAPQDREMTIDEHYPYLDDRPLTRFNHWWAYGVILHFCLGAYLRVKMGLRIRGREVLKKYKKELQGGAITIANHMFRVRLPVCTGSREGQVYDTNTYVRTQLQNKGQFLPPCGRGYSHPRAECGNECTKEVQRSL